MLNKKKDGFGITEWNRFENKSVFVGMHYHNTANGFGKFKTEDNAGNILVSYKGEFNLEKACGYGIYTAKNKGVYEGEWDNDIQNGYGIETWIDGSEYKGEFLKGRKQGYGVYQWGDGAKYEGHWMNNTLDGLGIYTFRDGRTYSGEWINNNMCGYGEMVWKDGKNYYGFFKDNKKEGFGCLIWRTKSKAYIGFWKENYQEGLGKFLSLKGVKYGIWNRGTQEKIFPNEKEFVGELREQNKSEYMKYFKYGYKALDMYLQFFQMK